MYAHIIRKLVQEGSGHLRCICIVGQEGCHALENLEQFAQSLVSFLLLLSVIKFNLYQCRLGTWTDRSGTIFTGKRCIFSGLLEIYPDISLECVYNLQNL